jgi:hypothetical protein
MIIKKIWCGDKNNDTGDCDNYDNIIGDGYGYNIYDGDCNNVCGNDGCYDNNNIVIIVIEVIFVIRWQL